MPRRSDGLAEPERARIGAAGDLFDAQVAFAEHELPHLEDEEQRRAEDQQ